MGGKSLGEGGNQEGCGKSFFPSFPKCFVLCCFWEESVTAFIWEGGEGGEFLLFVRLTFQ